MALMRITIAMLCPSMINFDASDFSERRSEEVISFFRYFVYYNLFYTHLFFGCFHPLTHFLASEYGIS